MKTKVTFTRTETISVLIEGELVPYKDYFSQLANDGFNGASPFDYIRAHHPGSDLVSTTSPWQCTDIQQGSENGTGEDADGNEGTV